MLYLKFRVMRDRDAKNVPLKHSAEQGFIFKEKTSKFGKKIQNP